MFKLKKNLWLYYYNNRVTEEGTSLFEKFGWIPNTILKLIYTDDKDILYVKKKKKKKKKKHI